MQRSGTGGAACAGAAGSGAIGAGSRAAGRWLGPARAISTAGGAQHGDVCAFGPPEAGRRESVATLTHTL
eukprot:818482-Prymnesium_polylepis.1